MCEVSEKLKLCTCAAGASAANLDHCWVLHRFDPAKHTMVIGRVRMPDRLDAEVEAYNRALLLARLNEPDAFDVDLAPHEGDRLQLTFTCPHSVPRDKGRVKTIHYGYAYENGRWREMPYESLSWYRKHDREQVGEIRPALKTGER